MTQNTAPQWLGTSKVAQFLLQIPKPAPPGRAVVFGRHVPKNTPPPPTSPDLPRPPPPTLPAWVSGSRTALRRPLCPPPCVWESGTGPWDAPRTIALEQSWPTSMEVRPPPQPPADEPPPTATLSPKKPSQKKGKSCPRQRSARRSGAAPEKVCAVARHRGSAIRVARAARALGVVA